MLRNVELDAVVNFDGTWHLSFRETKPEFVGLIATAVEYLHGHRTDFMHRLGGAHNFGGGIIRCSLLNPLYDDRDLKRVFDRGRDTTQAMADKDDQWVDDHRPTLVDDYRTGHEFGDLELVVDLAAEIVPHRTVFTGGGFGLRIDAKTRGRPSARLGSRPRRSGASTWTLLPEHPLDTNHGSFDMVLDANLRRIRAWSTALQYIEDFVETVQR